MCMTNGEGCSCTFNMASTGKGYLGKLLQFRIQPLVTSRRTILKQISMLNLIQIYHAVQE